MASFRDSCGTKLKGLGKSNEKVRRYARWIVFVRVPVAFFSAAFSGKHATEEAHRRQVALHWVAVLLSITDWVPYFLYTVDRWPHLRGARHWLMMQLFWATPATAIGSISFHVAWVYLATVDRPDFLSGPGAAVFALWLLGCTAAEQLLITLGWLYYTFLPGIRSRTPYEPVLKVVNPVHVPIDTEVDNTDVSERGGQLARLYRSQQSPGNNDRQSLNYIIQERRELVSEHVDIVMPVREHSESIVRSSVANRCLERQPKRIWRI